MATPAARGDDLEATGELVLRPEADHGLEIRGEFECLLGGTCLVKCEVNEIVGALVADAPTGTIVLIHTGNLGLEIDRGHGDWRYGSAAMVGRTAIVAIAVNGYFSQGEIDLVP